MLNISELKNYKFNNYSVDVSLNNKRIYIKVTDTITYTIYSGRIRKDLEFNYAGIIRCLKPTYEQTQPTCVIDFDDEFYTFEICFCTIGYKVDVILKEKLAPNYEQLSLKVDQLEKRLNSAINQINALLSIN